MGGILYFSAGAFSEEVKKRPMKKRDFYRFSLKLLISLNHYNFDRFVFTAS